MIIYSRYSKFEKLHQLIETEFTGKPEHLAIILGVTDRTVRRYIDILRDRGAIIKYSRAQQTYYFIKPVNIDISQMTMRDERSKILEQEKIMVM
jgi:predicted DNA-binding transcriptional regulator YafY